MNNDANSYAKVIMENDTYESFNNKLSKIVEKYGYYYNSCKDTDWFNNLYNMPWFTEVDYLMMGVDCEELTRDDMVDVFKKYIMFIVAFIGKSQNQYKVNEKTFVNFAKYKCVINNVDNIDKNDYIHNTLEKIKDLYIDKVIKELFA